jgi:hypothetical protein
VYNAYIYTRRAETALLYVCGNHHPPSIHSQMTTATRLGVTYRRITPADHSPTTRRHSFSVTALFAPLLLLLLLLTLPRTAVVIALQLTPLQREVLLRRARQVPQRAPTLSRSSSPMPTRARAQMPAPSACASWPLTLALRLPADWSSRRGSQIHRSSTTESDGAWPLGGGGRSGCGASVVTCAPRSA